jgi:hypothetical protein
MKPEMTRHAPRKTPVHFERNKGTPARETQPPVLSDAERKARVAVAGEAYQAMSDAWARVQQDPYDSTAYAAYVQARNEHTTAWERAYPESFIAQEKRIAEVKEAYPPGLERELLKLKRGDAAALEVPVRFLEADPWAHGTGYTKDEIIRAINRIDLSRKYVERLRDVVLKVIDKADGRREFRAYCRLARKVDSPEFRRELEERIARPRIGSDESIEKATRIRRRARWALNACEKP